ncbi:MAG: anti-sigma F factor [Lachnospiraceae bacterium]|nr:anti-sigma F factor [Lachnospiraceae bacterium]MBP3609977.1 anti-sigma F factor [Lachnospiraceae bacterium]
MENQRNVCEIDFLAVSENEALARMVVAAMLMPLNPTVDELADIKTAVSEAVTNAIIHGYNQNAVGMVHMRCELDGKLVTIVVSDHGVGIENIEQAMEPLYTSKPELERSGMGFSFMEAFMETLSVESAPGKGTVVKMTKQICLPEPDGQVPEE